ncbi:hypothetical protein [Lysobacter helvus]|uniref:hypothetical protein n=1 Tax=Lysobacter helvus TaxID=2675059 RepID=UPI001BD18635|nr:hypothetical protein [Lysobacter helvus]
MSEKDLKAGTFSLHVTLANDEESVQSLPIERLIADAELTALELRDKDDARLQPIEYKLVNPAHAAPNHLLSPGESVQFELKGKLEEMLPEVLALIFPRATYRLSRGSRYSLALRWGGVVETPQIGFVA